MSIKTFRKGGIHPDADKLTADCMPERTPLADKLTIMLSQSIGAPSQPVVAAGAHVAAGELIAKAGGFVGSNIHSPCAGTVKKIEQARTPQGLWQNAIIIVPDAEQPEPQFAGRGDAEIQALTPADIIAIVAEAGIVGLGGATFPTHVKLSLPPGKKADTIILNGAECEPYLTCDDVLMRTRAREIIAGARLMKKATGAGRVIAGVEENKPEAIKAIREAAAGIPDVEVTVLKKKYPQGSEKQLIQACTGRVVPAGGLPVDAGAIVDNVATAYAVWEAVALGKPLYERIVTVTGPNLEGRGNYIVAVGTPLETIINDIGGLPDDTEKVVCGGPMMGKAASTLDSPSTKGLSGVLVLPESMAMRRKPDPCIRCARCVEVCPMGLEPYMLAQLGGHKRWADAATRGVANCLECGCCSYICPSSRPILDFIRLAKAESRKLKK